MDNAQMPQQRAGLISNLRNMLSRKQNAPVEPFSAEGDMNISRMTEKRLGEAIATLKKYKDAKANLERRIVEEEQWWKLRHWDIINKNTHKDPREVRPEPTSAWLFNSLSNKHADIMDNYPEANVLPRERADETDAQILSDILPVIFERNNYEQTYSGAGWYKLKHGVVCKGVFWNNKLEQGLGDIDIHYIDILNVFWEPGITDIQSSRNLFIVALQDNDLLERQYPHLKNGGKLRGSVIDVKQYVYEDNVDISNKSVVVDWYYKAETESGKTILHLCKFVNNTVLYCSEDDPNYRENGYYNHGKYPVTFDVLFPEEGTPTGFGYISIMSSPQMYIDKLSQIILENSMMSTKPRYFAKKGMGINEEEFLDWSKPIVHVEGNIEDERLRPIDINPVPGNVINILQMKIDELKETSSNRDVSQGSSSGGVTAAAAIAALQEAGNKTSRDMIASAYRSFTEECYLSIELIRQFYDEERTFRITGNRGQNEYIKYSNANIQGTPIPPAYAGQELEPGYVQATRVPIFDVIVKPQKRSPYSKMAQNELAKEMYQMGFFNPQLAEQAMTAFEIMDFDGQEKVKDRVQEGQTLINQMQAMQQQMLKLGTIVYRLTGEDVLGIASTQSGVQGSKGGSSKPKKASGDSMAQRQKQATQATMTDYGQALASRATPDMNMQ